MFNFKDFLEKLELPTETVRLLRHDQRGVAHWQRGRVAFASFASFQKQNPSPYAGATIASHFIPGPTLPVGSATALFLGSTRIANYHNRFVKELRERYDLVYAGGKFFDEFQVTPRELFNSLIIEDS